MAELLMGGTADRITVTYPFDGAEVGNVADMPPDDAQAPLGTASAPCPATSVLAYSTPEPRS
jgi:hypothetical protein